MHRLMFVVPAHGRVSLARVCLRQLRRTCDAMVELGIKADAIVIACDENLDTARELGFGWIERDNDYLSRRFNDGIQLACDPKLNPTPADFVVPCGSDDWIDWRLFKNLPGPRAMVGFRKAAFVDETGMSIATREVDYQAGVGIRIYPRTVLERLGYRPADEDRARGCDTSILVNVKRACERPDSYARPIQTRVVEGWGVIERPPRKRVADLDRFNLAIYYGDQHPYQIVDWKSPHEQLNTFQDIVGRFTKGATAATDPFDVLAEHYPAEALDEMRAHYGRPS